MKQMLRLVICCLQVTGIYFLGRLLDLMLNMHQNTWQGKGNAESGCSKQSSSWGSLVAGPGGAPRSLGSKRGRSRSCPAGRLWSCGWGTSTAVHSAKHSSSHQPVCRHFISAVALKCWRTRQVECLCFSTLLSVTSPCRFQPCPLSGTWLPSRGVVVETCAVNFVLVVFSFCLFLGVGVGGTCFCAWRPGAELHQCCSSLSHCCSPGCLEWGRTAC